MLAAAKARINAANVTFKWKTAKRRSFSTEVFETTFISLVIHFTEPARTLTGCAASWGPAVR
jgi:hypothetical protein